MVALSNKTGKAPAQLSQWLNASVDPKSGKPRVMSRQSARTLEERCGKPEGWMDQDHAGTTPSGEFDLDSHPELARIRKVKLRLQAGINGYAIEADEEEGLPIFFRTDWMAQRGFKPYNLLAIKVRGESMEPALHEGDMVVIHTADTTPRDGEVFAINYEGEAVIKRLVRDEGEWWLTSDNPDQRRYPRKRWVDGNSLIVGRVVHKQSERI